MASTSERTFGQRYTKGRDLVEYLKLVTGYAPTESALLPANLTTLLDSINTANSEVASTVSIMQTARDERLTMFKNNTTGLITRCAQVRDYIASFLPQGKKSADYKKVQKIVMLMRGIRLSKKPPVTEGGKKSVSTSERSYGSMLQAGKDVLEIIKTTSGYAPSNTAITIANFTTLVATLDAKNSEVANKQEVYDNKIEDRGNLYTELADRVTKVKAALASQYGKQSNEYKDSVKY
ncbi:MAG: hypothetical protein WAU11_00540 [Ignavibacteriaceae bacterium]